MTLPGHCGSASHALVFMLRGLSLRWKQTVAYHFTGNSTDKTLMKLFVLEIIECAAKIGLHVIAVASDMESANRAMWRSLIWPHDWKTLQYC